MASRGLNIFLLIILAFIGGMWTQDNKEDIKQCLRDTHDFFQRPRVRVKVATSNESRNFKQRQKCECGTCGCFPRCQCENTFLLKSIDPGPTPMPAADE